MKFRRPLSEPPKRQPAPEVGTVGQMLAMLKMSKLDIQHNPSDIEAFFDLSQVFLSEYTPQQIRRMRVHKLQALLELRMAEVQAALNGGVDHRVVINLNTGELLFSTTVSKETEEWWLKAMEAYRHDSSGPTGPAPQVS